jgi:exportin-2 (importin alpha re-exporter)
MQKGSVPGLVKLLKAFLTRDGKQMVAAGQVASVLGIVQQRLIPSKVNDAYGTELLQAVVQNISPLDLKQYFRPIIINMLTRLQTSKTDKYIYLFTYFLLFTMAIKVDGLTPDYLIGTVEEIQPQLWSQVLNNFVLGQIPKIPHKDRKVAVVGLTRMLTQSNVMMQEPSVHTWPGIFTALVKLFHEPQYLAGKDSEDDPDAGLTAIDYDEQTAGYQAAYSRLAASESVAADPVAYVRDSREFLGQELVRLSKSDPRVKSLLAAADPAIAGQFLNSLSTSGLAI